MSGRITRRHVIAGIGALAGSFAAASSLSPAITRAAPADREIRVLTINIWQAGDNISGGIDLVADLIVATDASIVLLTEAFRGATDRIAEALRRRGRKYASASSADTGVLSVFPMESSTNFTYMTRARLSVHGQPFSVYSAHLEYRWYATYLPRGYAPGSTGDEFAQYGWGKLPGGPVTDPAVVQRVNLASGRPDTITKFLDDARAEMAAGRAVILGGDFNEPSTLDWTSATARLFDHNGVVLPWESTRRLQGAGFVDAYRFCYPNPVTHPGFTWPASNPEAPVGKLTWAPEADERDRIDYIFTSPGAPLILTSAGLVGPRGSIVRNKRADETTQDNFIATPQRWVSDHKAVLATYRMFVSPTTG
ncbi:endonuclease/exonuclease/phosphatase family protein [Nocardia sp. CDC159]|uniref:Endonuclease/exonuclease/phosphatase family protein n=1 Tax=Nocardia pulmonis TaxID=2951408 RepID=A0A9X2ECG7_9NOCA|nr:MULTISPECIES: endonuclease/exonuclease/phosphatase family protein [Nocardia]MCM6777830.1 endonuclease/exonuclease/phosphatase family protein [Nocardia pulmonis]MCM6790714.1 endonuclease/exonuclease/phosphatase family protein [Nocardia sp. CDC159]